MDPRLNWQWIEQYLLPHGEALKRWIRARGRTMLDAGDAHDVLHDALLKILQDIDPQVVRDPAAILYTVSRNLLWDRIRDLHALPVAPFEQPDEQVSPSPGPDVEVEDAQELTFVMHAIGILPMQWKQTLVLRRFAGLSQLETAAYLHVSEDSVEQCMKRAIERLRRTCPKRATRHPSNHPGL